ncbi:hypothetical protein [uncultured Anaerococcus sp.]|uniref:hypothetical protein n=1 Tax=uncultured Anaerococcus sp. TaxID=293428 RepID=UPI0025D17639|nr:hypothetical protein [uncultured Anaerococcus sp.]
MKNVYDKINDLDFETEEFKLTDIEREKLMKTAQSYKKNSKKKYMGLAAALLLAAGLTVPPVRAEVSKAFTDIKVSMMETIGASPQSYKYVTELHKPIEIGDESIVLENLVIEDDKVYSNILIDPKGKSIEESNETPYIYKVVINGETYKAWGSSGSKGMSDDGKAFVSESMTTFDKTFPELDQADIDLYIGSGFSNEIVSIKASSNIVNRDNKFLAKDYKLESGANIRLIKVNPITMTAVIEGLDPAYDYQVEGIDKEGNNVYLDLRTGDNGVSTFIYNSTFSDLSLDEIKDGREITFSLSRAKINESSGKLTDGNYEEVEVFTLSSK